MGKRTINSRDKEVMQILYANTAVAIGNLLLGKYDSWDQFRELLKTDFRSLPRRNLKAGTRDIRKNLSKEINKFYEKNFSNFSYEKIYKLWFEIEKNQGLNMPLEEFESKYFTFKPDVVKNIPRHATVRISLWKLGFIFPEDRFSNDILQSFKKATTSKDQLNKLKEYKHSKLINEQDSLIQLIREHELACRSCFLACFYFIEAYLNGIVWDWVAKNPEMNGLSRRKQALMSDSNQATLKEKLVNYPNIIANEILWKEDHPLLKVFLSELKPFRDSLVHPSPFAVPQKFGGYDKLAKIYDLKFDQTKNMVDTTYKLVLKIHQHIEKQSTVPNWLQSLKV